jgi:Zn-finger in ubiquitin-hydrolases and other protein
MADLCSHLEDIRDVAPSGAGCVECLELGMRWVHLRRCTACGHVGCCDNSPGQHATGHFGTTTHPIIQSYEPGEDWYWCYVDEIAFELEGGQPSPSHP